MNRKKNASDLLEAIFFFFSVAYRSNTKKERPRGRSYLDWRCRAEVHREGCEGEMHMRGMKTAAAAERREIVFRVC